MLWLFLIISLLTNIWANLIFLLKLYDRTYKFSSLFALLLKSNQLFNTSESSSSFNLKKHEFKSLYNFNFKESIKPINIKQQTNIIHSHNLIDKKNNIRLLKLFQVFIRVNAFSKNTLFKVNTTFRSFYIDYTRGGISILNMSKFFKVWKDAYYLIFNLSYYRFDTLTFGSILFKKEILAFNWKILSNFSYLWKYAKPILLFKPNRITDDMDFVFEQLKLRGLNIALVVDVAYHSKTIHYLKQSNFYSIGLVPVNHSITTLDFPIPTNSDNLFMQLFFFRFILSIQKHSKNFKYSELKTLWYSFYQ